MKERRSHLSRWGPVAIWMLAIFIVSAQSQPPMPEGLSDVSAHALAYTVLAVLVVRALASRRSARVTLATAAGALAITVGYGASDELHQMFVPGRTPELRDVYADAAGALIGIAACRAWGILGVRSDV